MPDNAMSHSLWHILVSRQRKSTRDVILMIKYVMGGNK
jgi:hypothetical protein